jgi:hypothetical protein
MARLLHATPRQITSMNLLRRSALELQATTKPTDWVQSLHSAIQRARWPSLTRLIRSGTKLRLAAR